MKKLMFFLIILVFVGGMADGTYITISSTVSVGNPILGDEAKLSVIIYNQGDETAYDLQQSLILPEGFSSNPVFINELGPDVKKSINFTVSIDEGVNPGRYYIALLTDYKDANGYGFSSISPTHLVIKEEDVSDIFPRLSSTAITPNGRGRVTLKIKNMDEKSHDITVRLMLPREVETPEDVKSVTIEGKGNTSIDFSIASFGALARSTYAVFASAEYDEGEMHYSHIAMGTIKISDEPPPDGTLPESSSMDLILLSLLGMLLILSSVFVYFQFRGRKR